MKAPIVYMPGFISNPDEAFRTLSEELEWEKRSDAPRHEYYCNDTPKAYIYGVGRGRREYLPRPYHPTILEIRKALEMHTGTVFDVCFLNRYLNQSDHLGWHSDDSPEMDDARPIGIVSLGVERDIYFRKIGEKDHETVRLGHGSLCLMSPGMQDVWQHRIPKATFMCGERISLTFRGYLDI